MNKMIHDLEVNMIVTTPHDYISNITPDKKYIILKKEQDIIWVRNDLGKVMSYKSIDFIEAQVYFALCFYTTLVKMFDLLNKK